MFAASVGRQFKGYVENISIIDLIVERDVTFKVS